jgi:hypothetical protein
MLIFLSKYKLQITIVFSIILALIFSWFIIYPQTQNITKTLKEITKQKTEIQELNNKKESIEKFKKDGVSLIEKVNNEIGSSLAERDILDLVIKLEEIAKKSNLTAQLQVQEKKQEPLRSEHANETEKTPAQEIQTQKENLNPLAGIPSLSASIYLDGEFKNILRYLIYLENLSYEIGITSLTINSKAGAPISPPLPQLPEGTSKEKAVNATLEINIFLED